MSMNANFDKRVLIRTQIQPWQASPMPGVERRILDRVGGEVARATSIVKYAPGSRFSPHVHTGGEEILVLDGVFQDEHGDYPVGSYLRNPPQSRHTPGSAPGCVILVKLWQFDLSDRTQVRVNYLNETPADSPEAAGIRQLLLHEDEFESVCIQYWNPGCKAQFSVPGGAEVLVLSGQWYQQSDCLQQHDWLRIPVNSTLSAHAGPQGACIWFKRGHLRQVARDLHNLSAQS
ncbi:cupin [Alteromonas aestuariivivens]|uniref:Cupin n=1 Tax=Alteromonas aestuariivivens TaxID=1938339 RepID=A0A3D8MDV2_9ALTE|nr:cupin domain-containing protein [Alteromonas aestuariivivens]RDV28912.1 cupin [Alteromonas aestuariivivens]